MNGSTKQSRIAGLGAVLLGLWLAGCGRTEPQPVAESPWPDVAADSGIARFFADGPVELGSTRADLAARLGEPDSVHARSFPNRHDPEVTDSLFTLYWRGLVADVHRAGYDGKEILTVLAISDDRFLQPGSPVRLGAGPESIRAALGEPDEADGDVLAYDCDECLAAGYETVRFVLAGGGVRLIEIRYWVD
jgi:hypothetical protein